jgi:peptide/nickel transport system substrate-binding protein
MKRTLSLTAAAVMTAAIVTTMTTLPTSAKTFRWASQGDPQTMDPYSQNESMTNSMNGQVYEYLVARDKQLKVGPSLAESWEQLGPLHWRFKLRKGVKFHDGAVLTADDVVFSVNRAKAETSQINAYANALGEPKKVDDNTVDFVMTKFNPVFLEHLNAIFIMNKAWCEKNGAQKPLDFKNKQELYTSQNANGTGPFMLKSRQPGVKTIYARNPNYWGKIEGNVTEIVYTPISQDGTRVAALLSGEVDFILDPPPQDVARLKSRPEVKVIDGMENRVVFIGFDQARDELLYSDVKGKNPFKDVRVRRAMYYAVDIDSMKNKLMRGQSIPTGGNTPSPLGAYGDAEIEKRLPFDLAKAKALMAEAGYGAGFGFTLDCPNNRYINDEEICQALAAMWAQIGLKVKVNAMPRATYFPKTEKLDTSAYMLGWGGAVTDAETTLTPVMRNRQATGGVGLYNYGNSKNDKLDDLAAKSSVETDPEKRKALVKAALMEHKEQVHTIPLHRQIIPWAARANVDVVHRADNWLEVQWINVK